MYLSNLFPRFPNRKRQQERMGWADMQYRVEDQITAGRCAMDAFQRGGWHRRPTSRGFTSRIYPTVEDKVKSSTHTARAGIVQ